MASKIKQNQPLKQLTTFEVGGPAAFYVEVRNLDDVTGALDFARQKKLKVFILGGGSNVLISDKGFDGLVIANRIKDLRFKIQDQEALVTIGAGENWDDVVAKCVEKGLYGIECLSGIPGSAGGAVVQNIGAYGQTISEVVKSVTVVEIGSGKIKDISSNQCEFEYRQSLFKKNPGKYIVTSFKLNLSKDGEPKLIYHDLQNYFQGKNSPSLAEVRKSVIEIRANKGNVILPGFEIFKTAGSFFKNPIVDKITYEKLELRGCYDPWHWDMPDDKIKVAAACLLLNAGYKKGTKHGNVGISPKHPLAVVNLSDATASQILGFSRAIQKTVTDKFNIELEREVKLIGFNQ
jgi:UDP-N-acetylmuramate dehydrogenase